MLPALRAHGGWMLIAATGALFATDTLFNLPFWLLAAGGLWLAPRVVRARPPEAVLLGALFLCLWLPQLFALPDAVNPGHALRVALPYLHFLLAGICIAALLARPAALDRLETALLALLSFVCFDALLQFALGHNLLGYPYRPGQLNGVFHPELRMGHVLAALTPLYLELVRRRAAARPWWWALALLYLLIIVLSGKRVAWMMAAVGAAAWGLALLAGGGRARWGRIAVGALLAALLCGSAILTHEPLARRVEVTLGLVSGNAELIDRATARRLSVWHTALNAARDNWLNGVGPRGFRHVYRDYAAADDYFIARGRGGQTHPHQLLLEVAAETGLIGLAGLALFWWLLFTRGLAAARAQSRALPWLLCAGVASLPLNAHLAFYGSFWSSVLWWLLACGCAALAPRAAPCPAS